MIHGYAGSHHATQVASTCFMRTPTGEREGIFHDGDSDHVWPMRTGGGSRPGNSFDRPRHAPSPRTGLHTLPAVREVDGSLVSQGKGRKAKSDSAVKRAASSTATHRSKQQHSRRRMLRQVSFYLLFAAITFFVVWYMVNNANTPTRDR